MSRLDYRARKLHIATMRDDDPANHSGWTPQPGPQTRFVESHAMQLVYGGARGGGKTDALLGDFARHAARWKSAAQGLLVRRTRRALEPTVARGRDIFGPQGARWVRSRSAFEWPSGATLYFGHLNNDAAADNYQGHSYSRVYVEELNQFPSPIPIDKLMATLRSAEGAPCGFRATCHPGGPGHAWVKRRYIDPGLEHPLVRLFKCPLDGSEFRGERWFIPARLENNPALLARDPGYVARLERSGEATRVAAALAGDWEVVQDPFFEAWSDRNIVAPFLIPKGWTRIRTLAWSEDQPFSVGWWALAAKPFRVGEVTVRAGALVRYREWYGVDPRTGARLDLTPEDMAETILARQKGEPFPIGIADPAIFRPAIFREEEGESIAAQMSKCGVHFAPPDAASAHPRGGPWERMRARIAGDGDGPLLVVFDTCRDFIRAIPALRGDPMNTGELARDSAWTIAQETLYACLTRRISRGGPRKQTPPAEDKRAVEAIQNTHGDLAVGDLPIEIPRGPVRRRRERAGHSLPTRTPASHA
jgi:hypothetical protein